MPGGAGVHPMAEEQCSPPGHPIAPVFLNARFRLSIYVPYHLDEPVFALLKSIPIFSRIQDYEINETIEVKQSFVYQGPNNLPLPHVVRGAWLNQLLFVHVCRYF